MNGSPADNDSSSDGRARRLVAWVIGGLVAGAAITIFFVSGVGRTTPTTPGAPHPVFAVPSGNGTARVIWRRPPNGGSVITGYRITPYRGSIALPARLVDATQTSVTISGLQNGRPHQFVVVARNEVGPGQSSLRSAAMIVGAPGQPATPTVTRVAPGSLVVSFAPPGNGGAPILRYAVTCISSNGGVTKTAVRGARRIVVRVLTAGKTYKCAVTATNGRGVGPASVASAEINA